MSVSAADFLRLLLRVLDTLVPTTRLSKLNLGNNKAKACKKKLLIHFDPIALSSSADEVILW